MNNGEDKKTITCIACPMGCRVTVSVSVSVTEPVTGTSSAAPERDTDDTNNDTDNFSVTGNRCSKGRDYAVKEYTAPERVLTTTMASIFPDMPVVSVKTDRPVPLGDLFAYMETVKGMALLKRLKPGDRAAKNLLGKGVDLIVTGDMRPWRPWHHGGQAP